MTDAERDERKAREAQRRKELAARQRRRARLDAERKTHAKIVKLYNRIPKETQRIFEYIHRQIMSEREADIGLLQSTRDLHLRPYIGRETSQ